MEKGLFVEKISPGTNVNGLFLVSSATSGMTKNGKPYWNIKLVDRTGSIEAKLWDPLSKNYDDIPSGCFVAITGSSHIFNNQLQINLNRLIILNEEETRELDPCEFKQISPVNIDEMLEELKNLCLEEFDYPPWRKLALRLFNDEPLCQAFKTSPAALHIHQAYVGGLLEHTLNVFKLCQQIANIYPHLDRQTMLAGALFHDIGKIYEFNSDLEISITTQGLLMGHIVMGLELLAPLLVECGLDSGLQEHFKHLVLSHHGRREWGAPVLPATAEAYALHYADNIDAKIANIMAVFAKPDQGNWRRGIEGQVFSPDHTPAQSSGNKNERGEEECLSVSKEWMDLEKLPF